MTGFIIIWSISCGISSPMLFSYQMEKVFVIPDNEDDLYEAYFCLIKNNDKVGFFKGLSTSNIWFF